jgi:hypothetical protein
LIQGLGVTVRSRIAAEHGRNHPVAWYRIEFAKNCIETDL